MPPALLLHAGHPVTWSAWHFEPSVVSGAFIACGLYLYGLRTERVRIPWPRVASFFAGALVMLAALTSPLDVAANRLLSMHMLQHVVLSTVGPPLVLLGLPATMVRRALGGGVLIRIARALTLPYVAAVLFILNMWVWHVPPIYETALDHLPVHIAMHILFMGTGLLFWWPVVSPMPEVNRVGPGARLLYLFVTGFPMGILALLLVSSSAVIYDFYARAPKLWGVSPLIDQQVAGVIMGSLGEAASFIAFSLLFWRYLGSAEEEVGLQAGGGRRDAGSDGARAS